MKKLLITTTDSLQGWDIEAYLTPVFASVVLGTNLFADFNASIADIFGGRSTGYEKRLQLIKDNAIEILSSKASKLGANCILGLKVDMDEISGKGAQMFMVTAVGMAVIAKNSKSSIDSSHSKEFDKEYIKEQSNIIRLAKKYTNTETHIPDDELKLIVESKSSVFKELMIAKLKLYATSYSDGDSIKFIKEYFSVIDPKDAINVLYPALLSESGDTYLNSIVTIIKDNDLLDYDYVTKLLHGPLDKKKIGLNVSSAFKPSYSTTDIQSMQELIQLLEASFPKISTLGTKKGFLSSSEKEVWTCVCGTSNSLDIKHCSGCTQDEYGFTSSELKPNLIIEVLQNRLLGLKTLLQNESQSN